MKPLAWAVVAVAAIAAGISFVAWSRREVVLPPPVEQVIAVAPESGDFVGAERCADCHREQYASWSASTHGRAGGAASPRTVLAPFVGTPLRMADARVIPRVRAGAYEFVVQQTGEQQRLFRVDGVVGGGHIYGGGTQAFVTRHVDGTWRVLPFEWSRQARAWFCNTNSRAGRGWEPITLETRLADCGDWPPVRVIGDLPRYANCQSCHASQATVTLDSARRGYVTRTTSLAINCEACHGPGRQHVEKADRGPLSQSSDIAEAPLEALDKDASLRVCLQCHAVKDQLREGYVSGRPLLDFYSLAFPLLGDRPLHPDGRARTFAYQEGHLYSACYFAGGMTCASCHDPHSQRSRAVTGASLPGRFDDGQCLSCHVSKADRIPEHTRHAAGSPGSACTACHMPLRQAPETRAMTTNGGARRAVAYARSDHTISIPRPRVDSALGMGSPCAGCHAGLSVESQERQMRQWWGDIKPLHPLIAAQLAYAAQAVPSAALLLPKDGAAAPHAMATFAGVARFFEVHVELGLAIEPELARRLWRLVQAGDVEVRAVALAALHLAQGDDRRVRRGLAMALKSEGARDAALRTRWALALGFKADQYAARGEFSKAVDVYGRALEVSPTNARAWLSLANAQRDGPHLAASIASYHRSLALEPQSPLTWVNLGIALGSLGDTTAARAALTRAAAIDASEPLAWFNLANILFVRGEQSQAAIMYERVTALDPSIVPAHFQLARLALMRRDERAALAHLRRGLSFGSTDSSAREMAAALAVGLPK